ncbi:hypothetical protein F0562_025040 [Nyssa sinensis]|uniref:Uncharacterized protein n=1 Tax=Nyssa sinensis TaxID=561372 RepID=A0A5J5BH55_9ASTE|nr:hypothetical protein F0562_025040 [Nyssa sinensis]
MNSLNLVSINRQSHKPEKMKMINTSTVSENHRHGRIVQVLCLRLSAVNESGVVRFDHTMTDIEDFVCSEKRVKRPKERETVGDGSMMGMGSAMADETTVNGVVLEAVDQVVVEISRKEDYDLVMFVEDGLIVRFVQ